MPATNGYRERLPPEEFALHPVYMYGFEYLKNAKIVIL